MSSAPRPPLTDADGHIDMLAVINYLRSGPPSDITTRGGGLDVCVTYENAATMREHAGALLGDAVEESHQQARHLIKEENTTRWGRPWEVRLLSDLPAREQALLVANTIVISRHASTSRIMEAVTTGSKSQFGQAVTAASPGADILATLLLDTVTAIDGNMVIWGWTCARFCADVYTRQPELLDAAEALARTSATPTHTIPLPSARALRARTRHR